jgi:pyruvate kinase
MLESMITYHKPTRAEAADVANAILDGTDAVMLSAESAVGKFPVEAVSTMATIARRTERAWIDGELPGPTSVGESPDLDAAVGQATQFIARSVSARAIVAATTSGTTARRVACHRPKIPILALCSTEEACRRMSLTWGVEPVLMPALTSTADLVRKSAEAATAVLHAKGDDVLAIAAGTPYSVAGRTNLIKIEKVSEALRADVAPRDE